MEDLQLPEGVTADQLAEWKRKHKAVSVAHLSDVDGEDFGEIIVGNPGSFVIGQFEKFSDKDPMKAREILIKGCLLTRREEFINCDKNTPKYGACFDACAQMLPVGKAVLKKL